MKYGFSLELELQHQKPSDNIFGASSAPCIALIPEGERNAYLPIGEPQNIGTEKMDCATRGPINILETKFTYLYQKDLLHPENKRWLEDHGYVQDRRVVFSDVFNAIKSGTTRVGNSLIAPLDSIHNHGLIPKTMLPQLESWEDNYNPARITKLMDNLGTQFVLRFPVRYERVYEGDYDKLQTEDLIDMAGYAWLELVNGVYPNPGAREPNHVFVGAFHPLYTVFDNYPGTDGGFIKRLASDYNLLDFGYRVYIPRQLTQVQIDAELGLLARILQFALKWLEALQKPTSGPVVPQDVPKPVQPTPAPEPKRDLLAEFCHAIEEYEGYAPGTRAYKNNNPGNLRQWHTQDGTQAGFAYFKTYEKGFAALKELVTRAASGKSNVYHPEDSIFVFFSKYAPVADDNNPTRYAQFVAKKLRVPVETRIKQLLA